MKLTLKQKAFADYYIETLNGGDSYIKAGYNVKNVETARVNASRLLTNANIKAYIAQKMLQKDNKRIMSQDELLERYTAIARGELTEEQLLVYNNRYERTRKEPSFRDQINAMKELAKRYSIFADKKEVTGDFSISVDYGDDENSESESES